MINFNPFGAYKLKFEYLEREYFEQDELDRIYQKTFASKQLEQVRDMFIFSCYTGLSYVDVCELRAENIKVSFDGNLWIIKKRHKTNVTSNIRLLDIPKAILQKYDGKLPDGKILPVINNQKVNDYLKEIATMCGSYVSLRAGKVKPQIRAKKSSLHYEVFFWATNQPNKPKHF